MTEKVSLKSVNSQSREDILEDINNRLKNLGIDSKWNGLPNKAYKQKSELVLLQRNSIMKKNRSFSIIREKILEDLEMKVKNISHSTLSETELEAENDSKPSKFKSIMSSMKTKALLLMKPTEKVPTRPTPLYRLTIQKDQPKEQEKEITPRKAIKEKEKQPVKREKIIIKPKKMYVESDSDSVKSDDEYIKRKNNDAKNSARKSISVTSLNNDFSDKSKSKSLQSIAQSISNLDSILELKKEIKNDDMKTEKVQNFSSEESVSEVPYLKTKPILTEQKDSDNELPEYKTEHFQKSVLKNHPSANSLIKKKVLFDLESDNSKSETVIAKEILETKKIVKTNTFFDFDKDEDSTSATSSVFDGSKTNLNQSPKEKISTKAQINISTKKPETNNSESDFDISDLL